MKKTLREIRVDRGISARTTAQAMGISVRALHAWENGERNIPSPTLQKILMFYGHNETPLSHIELQPNRHAQQETTII